MLSVPGDCYNYPTAIVHPFFKGRCSDLSKNPIGAGQFALAELAVGEQVP